jgi:hypothetical protein
LNDEKKRSRLRSQRRSLEPQQVTIPVELLLRQRREQVKVTEGAVVQLARSFNEMVALLKRQGEEVVVAAENS